MAEQALLRSAIKLHRIVRESDPAGRVGTARFAVIFEGLRSRDQLQERMVRLVTSGLIPARGAELRVPLKFHAACVMLDEGVVSSAVAMRKLGKLLDGMSVGTRRPVRFVEASGLSMPRYEASGPSDFELTPLPSTQP